MLLKSLVQHALLTLVKPAILAHGLARGQWGRGGEGGGGRRNSCHGEPEEITVVYQSLSQSVSRAATADQQFTVSCID